MRGFDFNGVVDTGRFRPAPTDIIVTGNTIAMSPGVLSWLVEHDISCPVYFNPDNGGAFNREAAGQWKASVISAAGLEEFYEDDPIQAAIISERCPELRLVKV